MSGQNEVTVLDYVRVVWRARYPILAIMLVTAAIAFIIGRAMPKTYQARATALTPREAGGQGQGFSSMGMLLGSGGWGEGGGALSVPGITVSLPNMSPSADLIVAALKSRTLRIEVFDELKKSYGPAVESQLLSVDPDLKEKGVIALIVEARSAALAAEAANQHFASLDRLLDRLSERSVERQEDFYRKQLERSVKELDKAETALMAFQTENRVPPIDASVKGAAESFGNLRGAIMGLELQREVKRMRYTEQHPEMRELEKQIAELKAQYAKNLFGAPMDLPGDNPRERSSRREFFVPVSRLTPVQFAYLRLYRNLKMQEAFYGAAVQGLEQLRYGQASSRLHVEVLDRAVPPAAAVRPKVLWLTVVAAAAALVIGVLMSFVGEYVRRLREQERYRTVSVRQRNGGTAAPAAEHVSARGDIPVPEPARPRG